MRPERLGASTSAGGTNPLSPWGPAVYGERPDFGCASRLPGSAPGGYPANYQAGSSGFRRLVSILTPGPMVELTVILRR